MVALGVISACCGGVVKIELSSGWAEQTNLYLATLLDPANRKSAVFRDAIEPLRQFERDIQAKIRPLIARQTAIRDVLAKTLEKKKKEAADTEDPTVLQEVEKLAKELERMPIPVLPRRIVADCTQEKLALHLSEQNGRLASFSDEGTVFDLMKGRYSGTGDPQMDVYLNAHDGGPLIIDRKGSGSQSCDHPCLTASYAFQPGVLTGLPAAFRGRGLLARFLYSVPKSLIGYRVIAPASVCPEVAEDYRALVCRLAATEAKVIVRLSPAAKLHFNAWEGEVETMLRDGGEMEAIKDWGGKLVGATGRIAALLHCVEADPKSPLQEDTMAAAIEIARYFIPHARHVLASVKGLEDEASGDARYVLDFIRRKGLVAFTERDLCQHGKYRFPKAADVVPGLKELESRGYIRRGPKPQATAGRPPSQVWEVNPGFLNDDPPARQDAQPVTLEPPRSLPSDDGTGRSQVSI